MIKQRKYFFFFLCLLFVSANIITQISFQKKGLDNEPLNIYSSTSSDALDYIKRAEQIAKEGDFGNAFKDGYRLPGYPLFLSFFFQISDKPLLTVRYAQIVISALIIFSGYFSLLNIYHSYIKVLVGTLIIAIWLPFYYFSPILCAESCSIFFVSILFLVLTILNKNKTSLSIYLLPIILAALVYLKPNHLLLFFPLLLFLFYGFKWFRIRHAIILSLILFFLLLPWSIFLYVMNNKLIPLSTTSGINFYLGTGVETNPTDLSSIGTIHVKTALKLNLRNEEKTIKVQKDILNMVAVEKNTYFTDMAITNWISKPIKTTIYGFSKIFHGFGFSFRNMQDIILSMFYIVSLISSIQLWYNKKHRNLCIFYWSIVSVISLQMFIFLPDQRFKTVIFDFPALVVIFSNIFSVFDQYIKKYFLFTRQL